MWYSEGPEWNNHTTYHIPMKNTRLAKMRSIGKPAGSRPPGQRPKRWSDNWQSTSQEQ